MKLHHNQQWLVGGGWPCKYLSNAVQAQGQQGRRTKTCTYNTPKRQNNLGTLHQDLEEHETAIGVWRQALELPRDIGHRRPQALLMLNLCTRRYRPGHTHESIRNLSEAQNPCGDPRDRVPRTQARPGPR